MSLSCHLTFDGQCAATFGTYQRVLGGEIRMLEYGKSPMSNQVPAHWQNRIIHATLVLEGQELIGSDAFPDAYEPPRGFSVLFAATSAAEGR